MDWHEVLLLFYFHSYGLEMKTLSTVLSVRDFDDFELVQVPPVRYILRTLNVRTYTLNNYDVSL